MRQLLIVIVSFFSLSCIADNQFEIPRSRVIELVDTSTQKNYPVFIKLPKSYNKKTNKQYPVIYLTDGSYSFQVASGATRFPMNSGAMQEAILVAVSYATDDKGVASRVRDYTPSKSATWKLPTGGASKHASFFRQVVIPFIEKNYRAAESKRTYVGHSLGGLFGAYLLLKEPDLFDNYILGSPSVWFNNENILAFIAADKSKQAKVYLAVGQLERPEYGEQQDMVLGANLLQKHFNNQFGNNVEVKLVVVNDATHATAFPTILVQGLHWLYGVSD